MKNIEHTTDHAAEYWHDKYEESSVKISEYATRVSELEALVKFYEEQFRLSQHKRFGASSEKSSDAEQLGMFDEVENTADLKNVEEHEQITYSRKKPGKRESDISGLPVDTVEYTLSDEERVCPGCGGELHAMSTEERCEIEIIPPTTRVKRHIRQVYACRHCEKTSTSTPIIVAPAPNPVIRNSLCSPSAAAYIMTQKFVQAVPLYRQEMQFLREGLSLSRQTMANWMIRCAEDWLTPLYERMRTQLLARDVLHADETTLQVLQEPGKKANTNSYMWLYRTSGDAEYPIVLYEYQPTRSSGHPKRFLRLDTTSDPSGFRGYLHTDGYSGYHNLPPQVTVVGCWAHVRRKFDEALKVLPENQRLGTQAQIGLDYCNRLFSLEHSYEGLTVKERCEKRQEQSLPIAEAALAWAISVQALPKSLLGKAIHYLIEQWTYLKNVFTDGRLELSNNRAERSIKPFVIGRKNWLFCNSQKGACSSSVIYSVIETAKENGLNPFAYLKFIFETMPNVTSSKLDALLPWGAAVPEDVKVRGV